MHTQLTTWKKNANIKNLHPPPHFSNGPSLSRDDVNKTYLNRGIPVHLVDGKSDWLISIMKDFDWLQVHINNSFKNSSLKATINIKVKRT